MCSIVKSSISQGPRAVLVAERSPSPSHQFPAPHGYSDSWLPRAAGYAAPRLPGARRPIGSAEATAAAVGSTLGWERPEGRRGIGWGKSMGKWDFTGENMERSWECNDIYICMYVCMHACMHVCMYVYIYIYIIWRFPKMGGTSAHHGCFNTKSWSSTWMIWGSPISGNPPIWGGNGIALYFTNNGDLSINGRV